MASIEFRVSALLLNAEVGGAVDVDVRECHIVSSSL